jgi:hypothetical protein
MRDRGGPIREDGASIRARAAATRNGVVAAAACAMSGWLGLLLATPSSPVADARPSAGIALACVLLLGPRVGPWIVLGTAVAHFGVGFANLQTATLGASIGLSIVLGPAEALEALRRRRALASVRGVRDARRSLRGAGSWRSRAGRRDRRRDLATAGLGSSATRPRFETATTWFSWWMASGIGRGLRSSRCSASGLSARDSGASSRSLFRSG